MIEPNRDKPPIEPMTDDEILEGICTLIKLLFLEWKKLETFHWHTAQAIQQRYYLEAHINSLYMGMVNMLQERSTQITRKDNVKWMNK